MNALDGMTIAGWEASRPADVTVQNHSSIVMFRPNTDAAKEWIADNVDPDANWFGGALAVEPRYVCDLIDGLRDDGLVVV